MAALGQALARRTTDDRLDNDDDNASRQAGELVAAVIDVILATLGGAPRDLRDAALLCLASDTLARESELVRVAVEHLHFNRGTDRWTLWLPFSKTNRLGAASDYRYVDEATMARIRAWQAAAGIEGGLLFGPLAVGDGTRSERRWRPVRRCRWSRCSRGRWRGSFAVARSSPA
jgi:integrase